MPRNSCPSPPPETFDLVRSPLAGINLIDASAGTGKTYTICGLVLRLLLEKDLTIEQILVVTYTEAATEDLRGRIRQQLRRALEALAAPTDDVFLREYLAGIADRRAAARRLSDALRSFDEAAIFTIHGFCQRMLLEHSFESNTLFDTELVPDDSYLVREITEDFSRRMFSLSSELFSRYAEDKLSPRALQDFLAPLLPHPFLRFLPDIEFEVGCNRLAELENEYIAAYGKVCREWDRSRPAVSENLRHSPGLKRNTYNKTAVENLITSLDGMAAARTPSPHLFEKFQLLAASSITAGTKKNEIASILPFYEYCENLLQAGDKLLARYDGCLSALRKRLLDSLDRELLVRKNRDNIFSFDDLLRRLHGALKGAAGPFLARAIARKYPAALIDEFQDTDPLQYEIFKTIYRSELLLFLIGDPKQAIYSFRGADIHTYMDVAAGSQPAHHTLGVNYRSDPGLVKAVNTLFRRARNPFVYEAISFQPVGAAPKQEREHLTLDGQQREPLIIWYLERDPGEYDGNHDGGAAKPGNTRITKTEARDFIISRVADEVAGLLRLAADNRLLLDGRKPAPGDIAILVRKNDEARKMQRALAGINIPSVLHSGDDLFASDEAAELRLLLEAVAAPNSSRRIKTALLTPFIGLQADAVKPLQPDGPADDELIQLWLARFRSYHELWRDYGFIRMFWSVMRENRVRQRLLAAEDGERRLTNILHLAEILHQEAVDRGHNPTALLGYLQERLAAEPGKEIEHQLRLESDEDRVKIVTIHKAKGLEYPVVFCPFTWEGTRLNARKGCLFHQPGSDGATELVYDGGSPELERHLQQARQEEMAENLRLLYVALTRAVHRCYLAWGPISGAETSAPAYLLHQGSPPASPTGGRDGHNDLMATTAARFSALSNAEILADLQKLAAASDSTIRVEKVRSVPGTGTPKDYPAGPEARPGELLCREFTGLIPRDWKISSFSSLTTRRTADLLKRIVTEDDAEDRDALASSLTRITPTAAATGTGFAEPDIFSFPQGTRAGTFLHELLEQADFSRKPPVSGQLMVEKLRHYGYETTWQPVLEELLLNVSDMPLHRDIPNLKLAGIPPAKRLPELEFYYPLAPLTVPDLQRIFRVMDLPGPAGSSKARMEQQLDRLTFAPARGFMRGFIDLVFEFEGRFYLVDWKSNYLGPDLDSYRREKLDEPMLAGYYFLQYHLYCLALHLYLKKRLPDYRYDSHFGGAFYLFLRGLHRDTGPACGIYYDQPAFATMELLRTELLADSRD